MKKTKKIFQLYQSSLKGNRAEEIFDKFLFRPISFIIAYFLYKLGFSPNVITIFSGISAIISFILFYSNNIILGGIFILLSYIFDLCDGQVARMSGKSSPLGRILDGYVDIISFTALGFGISFYILHIQNSYIGFYLMILLGLSQSLHSIIFDGIRNEYLCIEKGQENCREYMLTMDMQDEKSKKLASWFNHSQAFFFKNFVFLEKLSKKERDFIILISSFLGTGTKYFFIFLGIFLKIIIPIIIFLLVITNIIFIYVLLWGKSKK